MTRQPLGALPARFRRQRLLVVGCGDVGQRVVRQLRGRLQVLALTSGTEERIRELRSLGVTPLRGNLDAPQTLRRLAGLANRVLHLAPPPGSGGGDARTVAFMRALRRRSGPEVVVYGSTSGVYGDCKGARVSETWPTCAATERALRRVTAETVVRFYGRSAQRRISVLRIPGIYAPDRVGGTPRERLLRGTPVLHPQHDVYTNHIHADDLATACMLALWRARAQRTYNVNDDTHCRMGDYFDLAADLYGLPRPPRVSRAQAAEQLSPMLLSFMSESRQMVNTRMKTELGVRLKFPTVLQGLSIRAEP